MRPRTDIYGAKVQKEQSGSMQRIGSLLMEIHGAFLGVSDQRRDLERRLHRQFCGDLYHKDKASCWQGESPVNHRTRGLQSRTDCFCFQKHAHYISHFLPGHPRFTTGPLGAYFPRRVETNVSSPEEEYGPYIPGATSSHWFQSVPMMGFSINMQETMEHHHFKVR